MGNRETGPLGILPFLHRKQLTELQNQSPKGMSQQNKCLREEGRSVSVEGIAHMRLWCKFLGVENSG